jgi:DNA-binding NarL/FixJ family response regulator
MVRIAIIYGALLAAGAFGLQALQYQFLVRTHAVQTYVALVALAFLVVGVWIGARVFRRQHSAAAFEPNTRVMETLKISERELEVLTLLSEGQSNKQIANRLDVSPNTVKTHVANLFAKLDARRRTEAIVHARELGVIP